MTTDDLAGTLDAEHERSEPLQVLLHIGTMKTGTSYVQQVLARNSHLLEDQGIRYLTRDGAPGRAIRELVDQADSVVQLGEPWMALAQEATAWSGRLVVISNELLSFVPGAVARQIVDSLRPAEVTVVITARDLARLLPSAWQNTIKNGSDWSFETFVESVVEGSDEPRSPARRFWHHHDLTAILDSWVPVVGADRVVVIPVPPSGADPDLLWQRFASVLGVDPATYDASQDRRSNLSMGYPETELVRQVNRDLRKRLDRDTMKRLVLRHLANDVLRPAPEEVEDRRSAVLPPHVHDWAVRRSRKLADDLMARGVQVIGSVEELVPAPLDEGSLVSARAGQPPAVSAGVERAVVALLLRVAELEGAYDPDADGGARVAGVRGERGGGRRRGQRTGGNAGARPGKARREKRRAEASSDEVAGDE